MNKIWHEGHKLPKNATADERLAWHREHQKQCGCRPIPASLLADQRMESVAADENKRAGAPTNDETP